MAKLTPNWSVKFLPGPSPCVGTKFSVEFDLKLLGTNCTASSEWWWSTIRRKFNMHNYKADRPTKAACHETHYTVIPYWTCQMWLCDYYFQIGFKRKRKLWCHKYSTHKYHSRWAQCHGPWHHPAQVNDSGIYMHVGSAFGLMFVRMRVYVCVGLGLFLHLKFD